MSRALPVLLLCCGLATGAVLWRGCSGPPPGPVVSREVPAALRRAPVPCPAAAEHVAQADAFTREGKYADAVVQYERAIIHEPGVRAHRAGLAAALCRAGRVNDASLVWRALSQTNDPFGRAARAELARLRGGHGSR